VGLSPDRGKLEVLVGGQLGDDGGEKSDHPQLPEEDKGEDSKDEDDSGKDTFHGDFEQDKCTLNVIYSKKTIDISRYIFVLSGNEKTTSTFQRFLRRRRKPSRET
jgi:hypothetical protein